MLQMVRYKRYRRRRYGNSTRTIKMKIQSFMDISTSATSMQIITISAGGKNLVQRLGPQFGAYKYFKIGNIAAKLVPASSLPIDPTGLSYTVGDNTTVDPRDQLTPGMMRITNGEDVFEDITGLSDDEQHGIYNNMLLDPRWFKWMLQSGVKRHATPRYWQIGQLHQDKWPGSVLNIPAFDSTSGAISGTAQVQDYWQSTIGVSAAGGSSPYGFFQTGHRGVLGWLPTDGLQHVSKKSSDGGAVDIPLLASPPEVEVMKIILPKAYKTRYYYRLFITETVYFKEPIVNFGIVADDNLSYRPLDIFHVPNTIVPVTPDAGETHTVYDYETGGNYGDD